MTERAHHRPTMPGNRMFEAVEGGPDPAVLREAAEQAAVALVRGTSPGDAGLAARVVHLAETEGLEALADLWSGAPAESVAGALWRLYLLRAFVRATPQRAATEFVAGQAAAPVEVAVAGVAEPPGPDEVRHLVDQVLAGIVEGDFADVLFRAAAFARVVAAGRSRSEEHDHEGDLSAARLVGLAEQLEHAGRIELAHGL